MDPSPFALGFASLDREVEIARLPLRGTLPEWLRGTLLRDGPARFEVGGVRLAHWFDGFAMLHRFGFADGRVSYRNRMLDSRCWRFARRRGRLGYRAFATDPPRPWWRKLWNFLRPDPPDNGVVNVVRIGGRYAALTEAVPQLLFDPDTLVATGRVAYRDRLFGHVTIAHPHVDEQRGELVSLLTRYGKVSAYQFYRLRDGAQGRELIATLAAPEPSYVHSFGLSERFIIMIEYPLVVRPLGILFGDATILGNYRWKPELGTRIRVVERDGGALRASFHAGPRFGFHHVNAYEEGDTLVVDVAVNDDAWIMETLTLERLRSVGPRPFPYLRRYRLDLGSGTLTERALGGAMLDFPVIDPRRARQAHRFVYGVGVDPAHADGFLDRILRVDLAGGPLRSWSSPGCYPGEAVFVPEPGSDEEGAGVLLSVVLDTRAQHSFLLVLDAYDLGELARAELPHAVPFGFHGQFYPDLPG
jgi:carotenoid cleavage dioxygenase-like enzyme